MLPGGIFLKKMPPGSNRALTLELLESFSVLPEIVDTP
jgi:hypothetical protein